MSIGRFIVACWLPVCFLIVMPVVACGQDSAAEVVRIRPGETPTWKAPTEPERDTSQPNSRTVAGRGVVRLGNVSNVELHLYPAKDADTTIVVCPGGGFSILAWDLEGTEIAQWLQKQGINAAVLKYRVPTRNEAVKWLPPVQDAQRAIAMIRAGAVKSMQCQHVGILGFSAGGHAATRTTFAKQRHYDVARKDEWVDGKPVSVKPDFAVLVYPAYLTTTRDGEALTDGLDVDENTPPIFFAHAYDDGLSCMGCVKLFSELKRKGVRSSLHIFSTGGHGFGGRQSNQEKDAWLPLCKAWLSDNGF